MLPVDRADVARILKDYGICPELRCISELERYPDQDNDCNSGEIRLIVKAEPESGPPVVIRFKREADVTLELVESQSRFADEMRKNGIAAPEQYQSDGAFAKWYRICGSDVIVTAEQFVEQEIKLVDAAIAEKTGALLANMHSVAETRGLHVQNAVLFCDMVMQAVFEARLMDYPDDSGGELRPEILAAFLKGYCSVRGLSEEQQRWYPYLCALIDAFWSSDVRWSENSLTNAVERGDVNRAGKWLELIWQRLARPENKWKLQS